MKRQTIRQAVLGILLAVWFQFTLVTATYADNCLEVLTLKDCMQTGYVWAVILIVTGLIAAGVITRQHGEKLIADTRKQAKKNEKCDELRTRKARLQNQLESSGLPGVRAQIENGKKLLRQAEAEIAQAYTGYAAQIEKLQTLYWIGGGILAAGGTLAASWVLSKFGVGGTLLRPRARYPRPRNWLGETIRMTRESFARGEGVPANVLKYAKEFGEKNPLTTGLVSTGGAAAYAQSSEWLMKQYYEKFTLESMQTFIDSQLYDLREGISRQEKTRDQLKDAVEVNVKELRELEKKYYLVEAELKNVEARLQECEAVEPVN